MKLIPIEGRKRSYFVRGTTLFTADTSNPQLEDVTSMTFMIGNQDDLDYFLYVDFKGEKPSGFMTLPSTRLSDGTLGDGAKVPGDYIVDSPFVPFLGWQNEVEAYKMFSKEHQSTTEDWDKAKEYMENHNYPAYSLLLLDLMKSGVAEELNRVVYEQEKSQGMTSKESVRSPRVTSVFSVLLMKARDFLSVYAAPYGRDGYNVMVLRAVKELFNTSNILKGIVEMGMFKAAGDRCYSALASEMPDLMGILIGNEDENPMTDIPKDFSNHDADQIQMCLEKLQKAVDYARSLNVSENVVVPVEDYVSQFQKLV